MRYLTQAQKDRAEKACFQPDLVPQALFQGIGCLLIEQNRGFNVIMELKKLLKIAPDSTQNPSDDLLDTSMVLAGYEQTAAKIALTDAQKAAQRKLLQSLIQAIVMKPCNQAMVINACNDAGAERKDVLQAILAVLRTFRPEKPVTEADMVAATQGLEISTRFVQRDLPKILDALKLTAQYDGKKRRFASIKELKIAASTAAKITDVGVTVAMTVAAHGSGLLLQSPFVGRDSSGNVVTHLRPKHTEEGKAAARKVEEARYIAKQELKAMEYRNAAKQAALGSDPYATTGQASSWALPAIGIALVLGIVVAAARSGGVEPAAPAQNTEQLVQQMGVEQ